ncbi:hypothetical protein LPJ57_005246 [Coemansia sp. RSA 486]|nr:hypothetical protein LPJ57_005246 [Coemansia sp. RSA 486]
MKPIAVGASLLMYLPTAPPAVDNMPQADIGGNGETDSNDDEDNDKDRLLDAVADISAANSLPCEADTSSLAVVEALQCEQVEYTGARSYNIDETDSDEFNNSDNDDDNGFWLSIGAISHASSSASRLPSNANNSRIAVVETPLANAEAENNAYDEIEVDSLVTSTADNESASLPGEADNTSLAAVEALQRERVEYISARSYDPDETDSDDFDQSDNSDDRLRRSEKLGLMLMIN